MIVLFIQWTLFAKWSTIYCFKLKNWLGGCLPILSIHDALQTKKESIGVIVDEVFVN